MELFKEAIISLPKGLQIDNIVYNIHAEYHYIKAIDFARFNQPTMSGDYGLYAVVLRTTVLEKFGFKKSEESNEFWSFWVLPNGWYISKALHNQPEAGVKFGLFYWGEEYVEIKYLHELQNLYFALTKKELEIKL